MSTDTYPAIPATPPPAPPKRRRLSNLQRLLLFFLMLSVVAVFGAIVYIAWTESKIERIAAEELQSLSPRTETAAGVDIVNFLVVGTDDRASLPEGWDDHFGDVRGRRADVIMLAHMVPGEGIQLLSIPRDLKVNVPGAGTNRINAAYVVGGPDLLVQTVQQETGIPIHHYVEIDFGGFGKVVDSLGGVRLSLPYDSRDSASGFRADAGTHTFDGETALAYARSRKMEVYKDGTWQGAGGGDIARTGRQQELLITLFDQVTSPSAAFNLPAFLPTFAEQIRADEGLSLGLMAELGRSVLGMRSGDIESATLPVRNSRGDDGRAYVVPVDGAQPLLNAFADGNPYPAAS